MKKIGAKLWTVIGMEENGMKACYDLKDNKRPTAFATKEGTGLVLIVYKRETKKNGQ